MKKNSYIFNLEAKSKVEICAKNITKAKERLSKMSVLELFENYEIINIKINKEN